MGGPEYGSGGPAPGAPLPPRYIGALSVGPYDPAPLRKAGVRGPWLASALSMGPGTSTSGPVWGGGLSIRLRCGPTWVPGTLVFSPAAVPMLVPMLVFMAVFGCSGRLEGGALRGGSAL